MHFLGLPIEIVSAVIDQLVLSRSLRDGMQLRHVNHLFDREILRAYFASGIVDFHADVPNTKARLCGSWKASVARELLLPETFNYQAKRLSSIHATRLLLGRLEAIQKYGSALLWLHKLEEAALLLRRTSRPSKLAISPTTLSKGAAHRETLKQVCGAVIDYLGVSEIINSLDDSQQDLCCRRHYRPVYDERCSVLPLESLKRRRRSESALDWAILTAMYTKDLTTIPHLLESQSFQPGCNPELSASLQYSAGRNHEIIFRLLLDAGVDVNSLGHATGTSQSHITEQNFGSTLEAACASGHLGIVKICLDPDYGLSLSWDFYECAMMLASHIENHEISLNIVKSLLSRSIWTSSGNLNWVTQDIFQVTCKSGNVDLGKLIFENAPFELNTHWHDEASPLSIAVEHGHISMVMYTSSQHRICLDRFTHREASWCQHIELIRAMRRAAWFGRVQIASLLWTELDSYPMLQLIFNATGNGHTNMIEFLLSKGLDLSAEYSTSHGKGTIGEHALEEAANNGHKSTARFLLGLGIHTPNLGSFSCMEEEAVKFGTKLEDGVSKLF